MQVRRRRVLGAALVGALALFALTGCAARGIEESRSPGLPDGMMPTDIEDQPEVRWSDRDSRLELLILSGSNCPALITAMHWQEHDHVVLEIEQVVPPFTMCQGALTAVTHTIDLSAGYQGEALAVTVRSTEFPENTFSVDLPPQP